MTCTRLPAQSRPYATFKPAGSGVRCSDHPLKIPKPQKMGPDQEQSSELKTCAVFRGQLPDGPRHPFGRTVPFGVAIPAYPRFLRLLMLCVGCAPSKSTYRELAWVMHDAMLDEQNRAIGAVASLSECQSEATMEAPKAKPETVLHHLVLDSSGKKDLDRYTEEFRTELRRLKKVRTTAHAVLAECQRHQAHLAGGGELPGPPTSDAGTDTEQSASNLETIRRDCDAGELGSCEWLAVQYLRGAVVPYDKARGVEMFRRACDGGRAASCWAVAPIVAHSAPKDGAAIYAQAFGLFERDCDAGDIEGCLGLGLAYESGHGVRADLPKAAKAFRRVCDTGETISCHHLGLMYRDGRGVARDMGRAAGLFHQSCRAGNEDACISRMGSTNAYNDSSQEQRAAWNRQRCADGSMSACNQLGWAYTNGRGVPMDVRRSSELFERACGHGDENGCKALEQLCGGKEACGSDPSKDAAVRCDWHRLVQLQKGSSEEIAQKLIKHAKAMLTTSTQGTTDFAEGLYRLANLYLELAEIQRMAGDTKGEAASLEVASKVFKALVREPGHQGFARMDRALFAYGLLLAKRGKKADAKKIAKKLASDHPNTLHALDLPYCI